MTALQDSGATLLSLRGIRKAYGNGTVALEGFDLDLREGEFLSLLGPSGCGKSTALRLIAGLAAPTAGQVLWPTGAPAPGSVGFVFQEPTLMPWADVTANVALPLRLAGRTRTEVDSTVGETLERVGLGDFAAAYPRELSGGMKMRVSIARALVTRPRLLLMDEPFGALDEITRFRLNDDLVALWRDLGTTVVFVTHSVFESVYLSQRVLAMTPRPGRVFGALDIDVPRRDREFRTSVDYAALCRRGSRLLEDAMAVPAGDHP